MTPQTAARIARCVGEMLTLGLISPFDFAVFSRMFWKTRRPGRSDCDPDYASIARLAGVCRDQAIKSVEKLRQLGILSKERRHVLVHWGRNRSEVAARQTSNRYVFHCLVFESSGPAASSEFDILVSCVERRLAAERADSPLERALAAIAAGAGLTVPA